MVPPQENFVWYFGYIPQCSNRRHQLLLRWRDRRPASIKAATFRSSEFRWTITPPNYDEEINNEDYFDEDCQEGLLKEAKKDFARNQDSEITLYKLHFWRYFYNRHCIALRCWRKLAWNRSGQAEYPSRQPGNWYFKNSFFVKSFFLYLFILIERPKASKRESKLVKKLLVFMKKAF